MQILGRTQPLERYSLPDSLGVISRLGFDGVEICLEVDGATPDTFDADRIAGVRDRVAELGLAPHSISYHVPYTWNDDAFDQSKRAIRMTPDFGTDLFVFSGDARRDDDGEWDRMVERTRELVAIAEDRGVTLAQEFEPDFIVGSTDDLMRLFDEIPSENLAANLDLGHLFLCDPDPLASIARVGERIVHCHIENMPAGKHDHELPQNGDMDLQAYVDALSAAGYDGPLSLDLYKYDYEAVAADAIAYLRSLLRSG